MSVFDRLIPALRANNNQTPSPKQSLSFFNKTTKTIVTHTADISEGNPNFILVDDSVAAQVISWNIQGIEVGLDAKGKPKAIELPPKPKGSWFVEFEKSPIVTDKKQGEYRYWLERRLTVQEMELYIEKAFNDAMFNAFVNVNGRDFFLRQCDRMVMTENVVSLQTFPDLEIDGMNKEQYEEMFKKTCELRRKLEEKKNNYITRIKEGELIELISWEV